MSKTYFRRTNKRKINKTKKYLRKIKTKKHGIFKENTISNSNKSKIIKIFLEMINMVKLYHWKTRSFAEHKATDELYERLSEKTDRFIEVLMGKDQSRIQLIENHIDLLDPDSVKQFTERIHSYRSFLEDINIYFDKRNDSDLLSLRDDILADLNQFLYLLSMNK
jgi:uncharacterized protein YbbC (DUF1343 family)